MQGLGRLMRVKRVTEHSLEAALEAKETKSKVVLRHTCRRTRQTRSRSAVRWYFTLGFGLVWWCRNAPRLVRRN